MDADQAELLIEGDLGPVAARLNVPRTDGDVPGVVVIHGERGPEGVVEAVDRLVEHGFMTLTPDLRGSGGTFGDPRSRHGEPIAPDSMAQISDPQLMVALHSCLVWLRNRFGGNGRAAAVGFGYGGRVALLLATAPIAPDRIVICGARGIVRARATLDHDHPQVPLDRIPQVGAPLLGIFGAADTDPTEGDVDELRVALAAAGALHRIITLPGRIDDLVGSRTSTDPPRGDDTVWPEILAWLEPIREARVPVLSL